MQSPAGHTIPHPPAAGSSTNGIRPLRLLLTVFLMRTVSYLDQMSRHWGALVLNDCEAVMPLTWNKKYGISISHISLPFTAQLGVFGRQSQPYNSLRPSLPPFPKQFRLIEVELNHANTGLSETVNATANTPATVSSAVTASTTSINIPGRLTTITFWTFATPMKPFPASTATTHQTQYQKGPAAQPSATKMEFPFPL